MKNWITVSATVIFCVMITSAGPLDQVTISYGQKIFVSGINAAWKNFGGDVGKYPLDSLWFEEMIQGCGRFREMRYDGGCLQTVQMIQ